MRRRIPILGNISSAEQENCLKPTHHYITNKVGNSNAPCLWPAYTLVGTAAIACYLNGLSGDFVHDDIPAVTLNEDVIGKNPILDVFKNDFWGTPMAEISSHKSYRPLTTLTFRFNYHLFGLQSFWFHFTNVILHALVSVLFTCVALRIATMKPPFATLAGLLFAIHPIHTEAVTGIVGRADVLACVFFLLALLSYHGNSNGECLLWRSIIFGGLSMMSKETGITVFLVNITFDFYKNYQYIRRTLVEVKWNRETENFTNRSASVMLSFGVLLAVRLALLQGSLPRFSQQDNPVAFHPSFIVRLMTFWYLAAFNWWLLLCPSNLSHDWQMGSVPLITTLYDFRNMVTCFFLLINLLLIMKCTYDFENQNHPPLMMGLALIVMPFLPATNLFITVGFVIAERVLYIPSLGFILLIIYSMQLLWNSYTKQRQTILYLTLWLLVTSSLRTIIRNKDWRSRETLLRAGLMALPHNAKMHYNYANFLRESERHELAKSHYHKALKLWPTYASAHNNLGTLLNSEQEAEQHFLAAIRYSSDHVNAHYNLGQLYRRLNRTLKAEEMLERCIRIDPKFTPAYLELARLRGTQDMRVGKLLKQVIELNRDDPYYESLYARWLLNKGNHLAATGIHLRVLQRVSLNQEAMLHIFRELRKTGQKSRLFQSMTRWQAVFRWQRGERALSPHVYLQEWYLKKELNGKAKLYDNCSKYNQQVNRYSKIISENNNSSIQERWFHIRRHKTNNSAKMGSIPKAQCRPEDDRSGERSSLTPMMVHHLLDSL